MNVTRHESSCIFGTQIFRIDRPALSRTATVLSLLSGKLDVHQSATALEAQLKCTRGASAPEALAPEAQLKFKFQDQTCDLRQLGKSLVSTGRSTDLL